MQSTPGTENVLISPVAVASAMGLLYNAAERETRQEIQDALELEGLEPEVINRVFESLRVRLMNADEQVDVRLAASLWARRGKELRPEYVALVREFFDAHVGSVNFQAKSDVEKINIWCDRATNGMIKRIVEPPLPTRTAAVLLNAAYFKSLWMYPFDSTKTKVDTFYVDDGTKTVCDMMWMTEQDCLIEIRNWISSDTLVASHSDNEVFALSLPYGTGAYRMTIVTPGAYFESPRLPEVYINDIIAGMTHVKLKSWLRDNNDGRFGLRLPRFCFEVESDLRPVLNRIGIKTAFLEEEADLSRLLVDSVGWVDQVRQKSRIKVNESGTEVATAVQTLFADSLPPYLYCNKPFMIIISEKSTGLILFMGRIGNPKWDA